MECLPCVKLLRSSERKRKLRVDDDLETVDERTERWRSIYVIYFTMFLMSLAFSIVLTGVWPYLDKVIVLLQLLTIIIN